MHVATKKTANLHFETSPLTASQREKYSSKNVNAFSRSGDTSATCSLNTMSSANIVAAVFILLVLL